MRVNLRKSTLVALALLLAGCVSNPQKMSDADRKAVHQVVVSPNVAKPPDIYYLGPGGGAGLMFGALGAIATESGRADARTSLREFVEKNGVKIEKIVLEEFTAALKASGRLPIADKPGPGSATLSVAIRQYGLSIPNGFSSNLVPILYLECSMTDTSGKTVWNAGDRLLTLGNPIEARPGEALRNDHKAIEAVWREAARHLSAAILKEL